MATSAEVVKRVSTKVTESATEFAKQLNQFADVIENNPALVIKKTLFDVYSMVVERTSVDTGLAKANWNIDIVDDDSILFPIGHRQKMNDFNYELGIGVVYLYNNLEYISFLEDGTSTQAPQGMIAVTLNDFSLLLAKNSKGVPGF